MKKKLQHYVYRAYLKPWTKKGQIYCLRGGKIFSSGLMGVACERYFYQLHELTPEEIEYIKRIAIERSPESLKPIHDRFLAAFSFVSDLIKHTNQPGTDPRLKLALDELATNIVEDSHEDIEANLLPFLQSMLNGDTSFYNDKKMSAEFLFALAVQFMRTKRPLEMAIKQIGATFNGCDVYRMMGVISQLFAINLGRSLYVDRNQFKIVLLNNDTKTPFITADQPIINLHGTFATVDTIPDTLEFYYPLSPRKAMLLVEAKSNLQSGTSIGEIAVNNYNVYIAKNSYEQIFSNSSKYLESIKKSL